MINSSRYAVIDAEGRGTEHELTLTEGDKLLTPESKHVALGVRVKDAVKHCIWQQVNAQSNTFSYLIRQVGSICIIKLLGLATLDKVVVELMVWTMIECPGGKNSMKNKGLVAICKGMGRYVSRGSRLRLGYARSICRFIARVSGVRQGCIHRRGYGYAWIMGVWWKSNSRHI
ncbi:hypothetical protein [Anaerospora hongkongensis]|uniref:hypothetical protein n=1 Tax=Anaerospora hongkongensis TaxID=244830 RepID=UPI00289E0890|nr:hypothetical protein [Anaerospora hongkongensis]